MSYATRTMIVPAAHQQLAQGLCSAAAGPAGEGMFTTALSPTGLAPATHYISAGYIETTFADLLPFTTVVPSAVEGESATVSTRKGEVSEVESIAAKAGITLPAGTISTLLSSIDVSDQYPFTAMARLGVKMVQEDMDG